MATKSETVESRRTAKRNAQAEGKPGVRKTKTRIEIDLTAKDAPERLLAAYPAPRSARMRTATPALDSLALDYVKARDAESLAKKTKEHVGLALKSEIGDDLGIAGKGWTATWDKADGQIDYRAAAEKFRAELVARGVDVPELETFRREGTRVLKVAETPAASS